MNIIKQRNQYSGTIEIWGSDGIIPILLLEIKQGEI